MTGYLDARRRMLPAAEFEAAPNEPAVFLLWAAEGRPYLARTKVLHRRLARLLRTRSEPSRMLTLAGVAQTVEWYPVGSRLESSFVLYSLARQHFPEDYRRIVKLRYPAYVKLILSNVFPRAAVTTRLTGGRSSYFGPFRSRGAAEAFEAQVLDLFQLRRCQEDLDPRADHPGCIYGEMNMCLRPCQQVVGPEEYGSEVGRVRQFLVSDGASLMATIMAARDRFSQEMDFEEAARQHKRLQKIEEVMRLRDELARDVDHLTGVAVTRSSERDSVVLWFMEGGIWHEPQVIALAVEGGRPVSIDQKVREAIDGLPLPGAVAVERQDSVALLAGWYYSSWCDGEWIAAPDRQHMPYRRIVNAIARVAKKEAVSI